MSALRTKSEIVTGLILWTAVFATLAYFSHYIKDTNRSIIAAFATCLAFGFAIAVAIVWIDGLLKKKTMDRLIELAAWSFIVWLLGNLRRIADMGDRAFFILLVALGFTFIDDLKSVIKNKIGFAIISFIYWTLVAFFTSRSDRYISFTENLVISICIGLVFTTISIALKPLLDSWKARIKQKRADKKALQNSNQQF